MSIIELIQNGMILGIETQMEIEKTDMYYIQLQQRKRRQSEHFIHITFRRHWWYFFRLPAGLKSTCCKRQITELNVQSQQWTCTLADKKNQSNSFISLTFLTYTAYFLATRIFCWTSFVCLFLPLLFTYIFHCTMIMRKV